MGSHQGSSWFRHTFSYLTGVDPHLAAMFQQAMRQAGLPNVSEAAAFEHILADFLSGTGRAAAPLFCVHPDGSMHKIVGSSRCELIDQGEPQP